MLQSNSQKIGSGLLAFVRFAKEKNQEARQDADNICPVCGKPKKLYFIPTVAGSIEHSDGSEHTNGNMVSPQTLGLCCCNK